MGASFRCLSQGRLKPVSLLRNELPMSFESALSRAVCFFSQVWAFLLQGMSVSYGCQHSEHPARSSWSLAVVKVVSGTYPVGALVGRIPQHLDSGLI